MSVEVAEEVSFHPENGKKATGAATPMLTPTMPGLDLVAIMAHGGARLSEDRGAVPEPAALTISIAWSSVGALITDNTGPNTSSCAISISGVTSSRIVGPT